MRTSKRTKILEAALRVIGQGGVTALTFESVAEESQLTKSGLMYHFPTREALLRGIHEHLAAQWEDAMIEAAGAPAAELSETERLTAYAQVTIASASSTELLLMLETANDPELHQPWQEVLDRWTPAAPVDRELSAVELEQIVARFAADGLWVSEALASTGLSARARQQVATLIAQRLRAAGEPTTGQNRTEAYA